VEKTELSDMLLCVCSYLVTEQGSNCTLLLGVVYAYMKDNNGVKAE
jgi:hypothetical protein